MKYTVLQFCDFYTATMTYWVTILAMAALPDQAKYVATVLLDTRARGFTGLENHCFGHRQGDPEHVL